MQKKCGGGVRKAVLNEVFIKVKCSNVSLSLSHWYPGSSVVLDCIDS